MTDINQETRNLGQYYSELAHHLTSMISNEEHPTLTDDDKTVILYTVEVLTRLTSLQLDGITKDVLLG